MQLILTTSLTVGIGVFLLVLMFEQEQIRRGGAVTIVSVLADALFTGIAIGMIALFIMFPVAAFVLTP